MPHLHRRSDDESDRTPAFHPQVADRPTAPIEPRTDRRRISEGTAVVIKAGVIAGGIVLLSIWFHTRLVAVEMKQVETSTKLDGIDAMVKDIRSDVKELTRRTP